MSPSWYKVLHIFGVLMTFGAMGAMIMQAMSGSRGNRALAAITHGIGLVLVLFSGFGMIAKLGYGFPAWVIIKLVIWLLIGGAIALIRRMPQQAMLFWWALPVLGAFAAYLAIYKPVF
ncbi:MAG: hypothetical protein AAF560_03670 [Acidobacteriota bacterium]